MRSEERENAEFSGKMGHAGGVCRRSPSRERPQAKSLTFDFVAGRHAYDHGGPLGKDYFVADNFFCFVVSFFFSLSRLCQCKLRLASPTSFLLFFFLATRTWRLCWRGVCNDRGLGPGLEAGPRLDKRGSPRGLVKLVTARSSSFRLVVQTSKSALWF